MEGDDVSSLNLIINILIHIIILFTFLSVFFYTYASKIEERAFQQELGNMIEQDLGKILNENPEAKAELKTFTPILYRLQKLYENPDRFTEERNKMLKIITVIVIVSLVFIVLAIFFSVRFDCHKNISILEIIKENIILFIFVGLTEFIFFTKIAMKYIPSKPSLLVNTMIITLKKQLSK
jgi:protein-S-isoprenylcysteine O-methyltransferase Ste14